MAETRATINPWHTGDPCPNCGKETDTDKCGPLYCPTCNWQARPCEHAEPMVVEGPSR